MSKSPIALSVGAVLFGMLGLLTLAGCDEPSERIRGEKVVLAQVPDPVKVAIELETKNGTLKEIEKKTVKGKTAYEASVIVNGVEQETLIGDDGKVISRRVGEKDDDD